MASIKLGRGTTPMYIIRFKDGSTFANIDDVYITFEQPKTGVELTKHLPDLTIDNDKAYIRLTQEETLGFTKGSGKVQVRYINSSGHAYKSTIANLDITEVLYEEVI